MEKNKDSFKETKRIPEEQLENVNGGNDIRSLINDVIEREKDFAFDVLGDAKPGPGGPWPTPKADA